MRYFLGGAQVNSEAILARDTANRARASRQLETQDANAAAAREAVAAAAAARPTPYLASNQPKDGGGGGNLGGNSGGGGVGSGVGESTAGGSPASFNIPTADLQSTLQSTWPSSAKMGGGGPRASSLPSYAASIGR